jgi:hypothetical protein
MTGNTLVVLGASLKLRICLLGLFSSDIIRIAALRSNCTIT